MSGRPWFGCIIVGLALLLATGCQSTTGSAVVFSGQPHELRQLSEVADTSEPSSVRAQNSEATLGISESADSLLVPANQSTSASSRLPSKTSGYRSAGGGRLGKPYLRLGVERFTPHDEVAQSTFGKATGVRANVNVPIDQLTDFQLQGQFLGTTNQIVDGGWSGRTYLDKDSLSVGLRRRFSDNPVVNPYVGANLEYVNLQAGARTHGATPEQLDFDAEIFSWFMDFGCEISASERMSMRLGLRAGKPFDMELPGVFQGSGLEEAMTENFDSSGFLSSTVWLTDTLFIDFGGRFWFESDAVSLGGGAGYSF